MKSILLAFLVYVVAADGLFAMPQPNFEDAQIFNDQPLVAETTAAPAGGLAHAYDTWLEGIGGFLPPEDILVLVMPINIGLPIEPRMTFEVAWRN